MKPIDMTEIERKYRGQWVALPKLGAKPIAHGKNLREVLVKSKKKGIAHPLITRVPKSAYSYLL